MNLFRLIHNRLIFVNCVIGISLFASMFSITSCTKEPPGYLLVLPAGAVFSWIYTILNGIKYKRNIAIILRTGNKDLMDLQGSSIDRFNRMQYWLYIGFIFYFIWHVLNVNPCQIKPDQNPHCNFNFRDNKKDKLASVLFIFKVVLIFYLSMRIIPPANLQF